MAERDTAISSARRTWGIVFCLLSLAFLAGGYLYLRSEMEHLKRDIFQELADVGKLKAEEIAAWRRERLGDARNLAESPFFRKAIEEWRQNPKNFILEKDILQRLTLEKEAYRYADILLFGTDGNVLVSVEGRFDPADAATKQALEEALSVRAAVLSDLYRDRRGRICLDAVAPVFSASGSALGFLALRNDAQTFLFPVIQSWPTPSRSAETLLVRREGEDVLFLNDLRHRTDAALSLRFPLSQTTIPAVRAVLGQEGEFEGRDYRGVRVLADLRSVPESSWFLVAKMDASEILADARYRSGMIVLIMAVLVLLAAASTSLGYRLRQASVYHRLYLTEKEKVAIQEELRTTLYSIGDAVISTDIDGTVKLMNPIAERLTGWREHEARGKPLESVFHIISEESRAQAENPVRRVLGEGIVVGLANHTVLISRDGREIPIADAGAPIRDETGTISGVVLVFRDQTEERAAQKALREAREFAESIVGTIRESLVVLDADLRVVSANPFFYRLFRVKPEETEGQRLYELGNRQWDIPRLRELLEDILPKNTSFNDFEVEHAFPDIGTRTMLLNARRLYQDARKTQMILLAIEDITDRKRAEEALQESEEKYRIIVENSHAGILIVGEDYKFIYANNRLCEMLGREREEVIGHDFREFLDEESQRLVGDRYLRRQRGEPIPSRYEFNIVRKDGEKRRVEISSAIIKDSKGRVKTIAQILDVTDRKWMEEELRASEEKYRILHESAGEAIFAFGIDFKLMEINKTGCNYVGKTREELLGQDVFELGILHPDDLNRALENVQKILTQEKSIVVDKLRLKMKTGLFATFQVTSTPVIRNGEIVAITNVCRDITLEERLYEALEASERRCRFLFNAGNDAVFLYELTGDLKPGKFVEVNDLACQMTGYSREELLVLSPLDLVLAEEREQLYESQHLLSQEKHRVFERTIVTREGSKILTEISSHLFELNGVPTVLAIVRDITERKAAEDKLRESLREREVMLREIHHGVKNNMQIMSSLLRLQARRISDEKAKSAFIESQNQIRSMAMIHEKLYQAKDFSRVDFADYLKKMVTHLLAVYGLEEKRVQFKVEAQNVLLGVNRAIPCGLIFNELVSNALKHAFPEGKRGELIVRMFKDDDGKVHLIVKDSGPGLPETIDIHKPQSLGLQIVADLTKQLDGEMEVRRDRGSEFEITFFDTPA